MILGGGGALLTFTKTTRLSEQHGILVALPRATLHRKSRVGKGWEQGGFLGQSSTLGVDSGGMGQGPLGSVRGGFSGPKDTSPSMRVL